MFVLFIDGSCRRFVKVFAVLRGWEGRRVLIGIGQEGGKRREVM